MMSITQMITMQWWWVLIYINGILREKNFTIQEKVGEEWIVAAKMEIELRIDKAEDEWLQSVMKKLRFIYEDREKMTNWSSTFLIILSMTEITNRGWYHFWQM